MPSGRFADMRCTREDLDAANEHVAETQQLVEKQLRQIDELKEDGFPIHRASELLIILMETRYQLIKHRDWVAKELAAASGASEAAPSA